MPQKGKRKSHTDIAFTLGVTRWKRKCRSQSIKKKCKQRRKKKRIDCFETMESFSYGLYNNEGMSLTFGETKMLLYAVKTYLK